MADEQPTAPDQQTAEERDRARNRIGCLVAVALPSLALAAVGLLSAARRSRGFDHTPGAVAVTFLVAFVAVNAAAGAAVLSLIHARLLPARWVAAGLTPWLLLVAVLLARIMGIM